MARFSFDLEDLNGRNGLVINDASVATSLSSFTSGADYNGDGIDDLVISPLSGVSLNQNIQIIYGQERFPTNFNLSNADSTTVSSSPSTLISVPISISELDFNGDGVDDLFVTGVEQSASEEVALTARLFFGDDELPATINAGNFNGTNGLEFVGDQSILLAQSIDINGDDNDDLIVSTIDAEATDDSALNSYVLLGSDRDFNPTFNPTTVNGRNGFVIEATSLSLSFSFGAEGDINDDGINDLTLNSFGVPDRANTGSIEDVQSSSSILFGSETFPASVDADDLDGENGFTIVNSDNDAPGSEFTVSSITEDVNGDGVSDLLISQGYLEESADGSIPDIGDPAAGDSGEVSNQRVFTIFGREEFNPVFDLVFLNGNNGFEFVNSDSDESNLTSSRTLDINNDGLQDFVVRDEENSQTYVVFGSEDFDATIDLADLDGDNGFALAEEPDFVYTTSNVGDVNADGIDDLILETDIDKTYVVLGTEDDFEAEFKPTRRNANALVIFAQDAETSITDIIDLNGDGADDLVYTPGIVADPFGLAEPENNDVPGVQVVFGDSDLGTAS
ncbi:MAG: hypothetical protein AAGK10_13845 [Cyanobacteria bacterium J06555_3]